MALIRVREQVHVTLNLMAVQVKMAVEAKLG